MTTNDTGSQEISRISIRPPKFSKEKPLIWLIQMEAQFATNGITQDLTKYSHALQSFDADVISEVSELVTNPPANGKYEALKTRILAEFQDSEEKRLKTLLNQTVLGDQRPSRLLRHMKDLAEDRMSDDLFKSIWLQRLPTNMQTVLSASGDTLTLDKLTAMADKIYDITTPSSSVLQVAEATASTSSREGELCEIVKKLDQLLSRRQRSSPRRRGRSRTGSRSRSSSANTKYCWYHRCFGRNAKKCSAPCSWDNKKEDKKKQEEN
ncbi:uncharacterized protein LOC120359582 [Solenopsis invicta]|uniref:uncharacterized protein LOC120359582 n=1 Tax=Solenopsis invicta TaxID=13686 RepID=UPI00193E5910|nr:uncharacterized protein LOC120359582 [Solenopsis invicta]